MSKCICIFSFLYVAALSSFAQSVGINTANPHSSAVFEIVSTDKGILVPRMTSSQRMSISNATAGLLVYQTDAPSGFYYYNGSNWSGLGNEDSPPLPVSKGGTGTSNASTAINNMLAPSGGAGAVLTTDGNNTNWATPTAVRYFIVVQGIYPSYGNGCLNDEGYGCMGQIIIRNANAPYNGDIMPCNGQLLDIATYPALFSLLGTFYGGDGITTFALPNLNAAGAFPVGQ